MNIGQPVWPFVLTAIGAGRPTRCGGIWKPRPACRLRRGVAATVLMLGGGAPGGWGRDEWLLREPGAPTWLAEVGAMPDDGPALAILQQWIAARSWIAQGVRFDSIVATGIGKVTRRLLEGQLTLAAALYEATMAMPTPADPDRTKLAAALTTLRQNGPLLMLGSHASDPLEVAATQIAYGLDDIVRRPYRRRSRLGGYASPHRGRARYGSGAGRGGAVAPSGIRPFAASPLAGAPANERFRRRRPRGQLGMPGWHLSAAPLPGPVPRTTLLVRLDRDAMLHAGLFGERLGTVEAVDPRNGLGQRRIGFARRERMGRTSCTAGGRLDDHCRRYSRDPAGCGAIRRGRSDGDHPSAGSRRQGAHCAC